jgi:hypothetical protein
MRTLRFGNSVLAAIWIGVCLCDHSWHFHAIERYGEPTVVQNRKPCDPFKE